MEDSSKHSSKHSTKDLTSNLEFNNSVPAGSYPSEV